mmetsp:Transcript_22168/g.39295  ORF Transcript_22168/g.39295 Transcript_22168/m.39295 type:complete len:324 (-) Transcript_22168:82-1053(-)
MPSSYCRSMLAATLQFILDRLVSIEETSRLLDRDPIINEALSPPRVVVIVVYKPIGFQVLLRIRIGGDELDEGSGDRWREELLGFLKHTPVLDEMLRETRGRGVGGLALHFSVNLSRNDCAGVDRRVSGRKLFLEHFYDSVGSKLRDTVWAVVREASALFSNSREEQDTVLVGIAGAEVLVNVLGKVERSVHVDVHHTVPLLRGQIHHHLARSVDSSIVDEDSESLAGLFDSLSNLSTTVLITNIADHRNHLSLESHLVGLSLSGFHFVFEGSEDDGGDSTFKKGESGSLSDSGPTASDDVTFVVGDGTLGGHHADRAAKVVQ